MQPSKKQQWDSHSIFFIQKKAHSQNVLGVNKHTQNTFLTSSQDKTVRIWDIRVNSSVKLIRNPIFSDNGENFIYVGSDKSLYKFDARMEQIFIQDIIASTKQSHLDSISQIKYSRKFDELIACDDEGDIRAYNESLECVGLLDQMHKNICNSVDYLYPQNKQIKVCVSGGFDSTLNVWNITQESVIKQINLQELMAKNQINLQNYPFIHHLHCFKNYILAAQENGHVICWSFSDLKKPKFILPASLVRVNCCKIASFNEKILITTSIDDSFTLFDFLQRKDGLPTFLQKYKAPAQPNSIETVGNNIILGMNSPSIGICAIKG